MHIQQQQKVHLFHRWLEAAGDHPGRLHAVLKMHGGRSGGLVLLVGQWRRRLRTRLRLVLLLWVVVRRLKLWLLLALVVHLLAPRRLRLRLRPRVCVWQARPPPRAVLSHRSHRRPRHPGPAGALVEDLSVHVFPLPLPFLGRSRR